MVILLSLFTSAVAVMAVPLIAETRAAGPNSSQVYINKVTYGGSGCPDGTARIVLSDDRESFVKSRILHLT
jgi:hypothetical protein